MGHLYHARLYIATLGYFCSITLSHLPITRMRDRDQYRTGRLVYVNFVNGV